MIYGEVITTTGWTWEQVDELTLPQYRMLQRYWNAHPATHYSAGAIAIGLGAQRKESELNRPRAQVSKSGDTSAEELVKMMSVHGLDLTLPN